MRHLFASAMLAILNQFVVEATEVKEGSSSRFESFEKLMDQFEFQWEVHEVTTDDGYILNMFRLVGPREESRLYD